MSDCFILQDPWWCEVAGTRYQGVDYATHEEAEAARKAHERRIIDEEVTRKLEQDGRKFEGLTEEELQKARDAVSMLHLRLKTELGPSDY